MLTEKLVWTRNGRTTEIVLDPDFLNITIDGKYWGSTGMIEEAPAHLKAMGAVGVIGPVGLTRERKDELLVAWNRVKAQPKEIDPLAEFYRLESALATARDNVLTRNDRRSSDPAQVYAQEAEAEANLNAWITSHQDFEPYRKEMARREVERKAHEQELAESFIARGID